MKVSIDQVWSTPSTLHCRVVVWADDRAWRQKHYVAVPLETIEPQALEALTLLARPEKDPDDTNQALLF